MCLMACFQLVRLAAGDSLRVRVLLQTPELVAISLNDPADGGKINSLIAPRLLLTSDDAKSAIELQGSWQLGGSGNFCTCTFQILKAGKYSAGAIAALRFMNQRLTFPFAALSLLHTRQNFSVALPLLPLESAIVCSHLGSALQPAAVDCLLTVDAAAPSSRTSILTCNTTCSVGDLVHVVGVFFDDHRNICSGAGVKISVAGPADSLFVVVLNPPPSGAAASAALAAIGNATTKLLIAEGHSNSLLHASFQLVRAGDFRICGPFSASPILIQARPGPAFPLNCSLSGSGAQDINLSAANKAVQVVVECRDQFHNSCVGDNLGLTATFTPDSGSAEILKVLPKGSSFEYTVSRAGKCQLVASVNRVELPPICISVVLSSPEQALRHLKHLRDLAASFWTQAQEAATSCELAAAGDIDTQWQIALGSSNAASVKACQALSVVTSSIHDASVEELARAQQLYDDIIRRVRVSDALARQKSYKRERLRWGDGALVQLSQSLEQRKMASADLLCRDLQQLVDEFIIDRSSVQPYVDGIAAAERAIRVLREHDRAKEALALQQRQALEEERQKRLAAAAEAAAKAADAAKAAAKAAAAAPPPKRTGGGFVIRFTGNADTASAARSKSQAQTASEYPY